MRSFIRKAKGHVLDRGEVTGDLLVTIILAVLVVLIFLKVFNLI